MEYREMVQIFKENGIDIEKHGYTYGLKLVGCGPSEGYIINQNTGKYAHMVIGDRDNGRIDREYSSEDAAVADMICDIRRNAIHRKTKYNKKPDTSEINLKILNIATFLDAKVNGYKGFKISKESDRPISVVKICNTEDKMQAQTDGTKTIIGMMIGFIVMTVVGFLVGKAIEPKLQIKHGMIIDYELQEYAMYSLNNIPGNPVEKADIETPFYYGVHCTGRRNGWNFTDMG